MNHFCDVGKKPYASTSSFGNHRRNIRGIGKSVNIHTTSTPDPHLIHT